MKFLSLTKTEVIKILLRIVVCCLELLCVFTMLFIIPFLFIMPSLGMVIYAALWLIIAFYDGFVPDRYWEWYVKGYNEFKVSIGTWVFLLAYTALDIYIYGDEMKLSYLESREDYKLEDENS